MVGAYRVFGAAFSFGFVVTIYRVVFWRFAFFVSCIEIKNK